MNCHCGSPATVVYRITPRRDVEPLTPEMRRATCLPGQASPCDVGACSNQNHARQVKDAAVCVLSVRALGDAVEYRVLKGEKEPQP